MATFDEIAREFGGLDILINNAGITRDAVLIKVENGKVLRRVSMGQWQKVIDVNLSGVFSVAARRRLKWRRSGEAV
jgi:3-oxoacyl-[acyl-carrier protein] reductase